MDNNFLLPFMKSTRNVFETMFQMPVTFGSPELKREPFGTNDVSAIIAMSGDIEGVVVLAFTQDTARRVVAVFTASEAPLNNEDLSDAVGELVNMIAGGAKAQFNGKNISISCPSVVLGSSHKVYGGKDIVTVSIPCACDCGDFHIEVSSKPTNAGATNAPAKQAANV